MTKYIPGAEVPTPKAPTPKAPTPKAPLPSVEGGRTHSIPKRPPTKPPPSVERGRTHPIPKRPPTKTKPEYIGRIRKQFLEQGEKILGKKGDRMHPSSPREKQKRPFIMPKMPKGYEGLEMPSKTEILTPGGLLSPEGEIKPYRRGGLDRVATEEELAELEKKRARRKRLLTRTLLALPPEKPSTREPYVIPKTKASSKRPKQADIGTPPGVTRDRKGRFQSVEGRHKGVPRITPKTPRLRR